MAGGSTTFTVSCTASAVTSGGKVVIDAYIGSTHVKHEELNYCDIAKCPSPTGKIIYYTYSYFKARVSP